MLLAHAVVLGEARSYLAALADHAETLDGALEFERVLLQLDWIHGGAVPPSTPVRVVNPAMVFDLATAAISNLGTHGVDALQLEICLAMLSAARVLDART